MPIRVFRSLIVCLFFATLYGCGPTTPKKQTVRIDGSSTVQPIMTAAAELYGDKADIRVGVSGTGGGFKKFLDERPNLRTDISNASRPIKPVEVELASKVGVDFIELAIGFDGIAVVINPQNDWAKSLTMPELRRIWSRDGNVKTWKDVRDTFPDVPITLYGPGTDSGTFDFFIETVVGERENARSDYTMSEDDNVIVQGVSRDKGGIGYFGLAYFKANENKLAVLGIDPGDGVPVKPSLETVRSGSYHPLSRPLLVYVSTGAAARPGVQTFLQFLLENAERIVEHPKVGYVALPPEMYQLARRRLDRKVTGTVFAGARQDKSLEELFRVDEG